MGEYKICARCVMDTSDPDIVFDDQGNCNHCTNALRVMQTPRFNKSAQERDIFLQKKINDIKKKGKGKKYDCIIGLSGGVDSSYVAMKVKELGLRPLAVHLDNGWDSELAVQNIENICKHLEIDLFTYIIDWDEFKDLQLAFLKASTPDSEIPSDHAIVSALYKVAHMHSIGFIVAGFNWASESILPRAWSQGHYDWKYIKDVWKKHGKFKLRTFPYRSIWTIIVDRFRVKWFDILDFIDYDKEKVKIEITEKLGWRNYTRKHGESNYTRVYQDYILPTKFGYDKRRAHLSSLIVAGQLAREEALELLKISLYKKQDEIEHDVEYLIKKFTISKEEFSLIMSNPPKTIEDYKNSKNDVRIKLFDTILTLRRRFLDIF